MEFIISPGLCSHASPGCLSIYRCVLASIKTDNSAFWMLERVSLPNQVYLCCKVWWLCGWYDVKAVCGGEGDVEFNIDTWIHVFKLVSVIGSYCCFCTAFKIDFKQVI